MKTSQAETVSSCSGTQAGASLTGTLQTFSLACSEMSSPPPPALVVPLTTKAGSNLLSNSFDWLLPVQRIQLKPILVTEH